MRLLGVRAAPKEASFAVFCTETQELVCVDQIKIPLILETPEKLKFIRNNILDILREYSVSRACIRITESSSQNLNIDRLYIEGVIQEALSSSNVSSYANSRQKTICSKLGITSQEFKVIIKGERDFRNISTSSYGPNTNEAILASLSMEGV
ncbi:Uncharacterised protein [Yersinia intermedia]|uniref:hypothetical protein n=1 Tax=Yersinia intermedia TaxID=631 RepID=UPI0005E58803|nr:hypothetical protein [Yersinia intermedia]CQD74127.1 Uncharacterised protein [Yersinia intermedia]